MLSFPIWSFSGNERCLSAMTDTFMNISQRAPPWPLSLQQTQETPVRDADRLKWMGNIGICKIPQDEFVHDCHLPSFSPRTSKHALLLSQPRIHIKLFKWVYSFFSHGSSTFHTSDIPFMQLNAAAATLPETPYVEVLKEMKESDLWQFTVKASSLNLNLQSRDAG